MSEKIINGQAQQDKFVIKVLNGKENGYFIEIGSNHPIGINNTYTLEKNLKWKGIMIEYDAAFLPLYKIHRSESIHIIDDATKIDYKLLFETNNVPLNIDYLQVDLEVDNSTLKTLKKLDDEIFDSYKFATITFEHDIYVSNRENTRDVSRQIFQKRGYLCVFKDVSWNGRESFEDWYVYPSLVNMRYVKHIMDINKKNYKYCNGMYTIHWKNISYR